MLLYCKDFVIDVVGSPREERLQVILQSLQYHVMSYFSLYNTEFLCFTWSSYLLHSMSFERGFCVEPSVSSTSCFWERCRTDFCTTTFLFKNKNSGISVARLYLSLGSPYFVERMIELSFSLGLEDKRTQRQTQNSCHLCFSYVFVQWKQDIKSVKASNRLLFFWSTKKHLRWNSRQNFCKHYFPFVFRVHCYNSKSITHVSGEILFCLAPWKSRHDKRRKRKYRDCYDVRVCLWWNKGMCLSWVCFEFTSITFEFVLEKIRIENSVDRILFFLFACAPSIGLASENSSVWPEINDVGREFHK